MVAQSIHAQRARISGRLKMVKKSELDTSSFSVNMSELERAQKTFHPPAVERAKTSSSSTNITLTERRAFIAKMRMKQERKKQVGCIMNRNKAYASSKSKDGLSSTLSYGSYESKETAEAEIVVIENLKSSPERRSEILRAMRRESTGRGPSSQDRRKNTTTPSSLVKTRYMSSPGKSHSMDSVERSKESSTHEEQYGGIDEFRDDLDNHARSAPVYTPDPRVMDDRIETISDGTMQQKHSRRIELHDNNSTSENTRASLRDSLRSSESSIIARLQKMKILKHETKVAHSTSNARKKHLSNASASAQRNSEIRAYNAQNYQSSSNNEEIYSILSKNSNASGSSKQKSHVTWAKNHLTPALKVEADTSQLTRMPDNDNTMRIMIRAREIVARRTNQIIQGNDQPNMNGSSIKMTAPNMLSFSHGLKDNQTTKYQGENKEDSSKFHSSNDHANGPTSVPLNNMAGSHQNNENQKSPLPISTQSPNNYSDGFQIEGQQQPSSQQDPISTQSLNDYSNGFHTFGQQQPSSQQDPTFFQPALNAAYYAYDHTTPQYPLEPSLMAYHSQFQSTKTMPTSNLPMYEAGGPYNSTLHMSPEATMRSGHFPYAEQMIINPSHHDRSLNQAQAFRYDNIPTNYNVATMRNKRRAQLKTFKTKPAKAPAKPSASSSDSTSYSSRSGSASYSSRSTSMDSHSADVPYYQLRNGRSRNRR